MTVEWNDERAFSDPDRDFFSYAQGTNWYMSVYCKRDYCRPVWEVQLGPKEPEVVDKGESRAISAAKVDAVTHLRLLLAKMSSELD